MIGFPRGSVPNRGGRVRNPSNKRATTAIGTVAQYRRRSFRHKASTHGGFSFMKSTSM